APEGAAPAADPRGSEDNRPLGGLFQHRQQGLGEHELGADIDLHHPLPAAQLVAGDGGALPQFPGIVEQAVEAAELFVDGGAQAVVVVLAGSHQVHRIDAGLRPAAGDNLVVDPLQFGRGAAGENHRGAVGGIGQGGAFTDAVAGAGDENDVVRQQVGGGLVGVEGGGHEQVL